jgi:prolipoprotein diacylglyceryltransferase
VICYAFFRFWVEFLRGDPRGTVFGSFSTSQAIAAGAFLAALFFYLRGHFKIRHSAA